MSDGHEPRVDAPTVDETELAADIVRQTHLPQHVVRTVLAVEHEHLVALGVIDDPQHVFRYYPPNEPPRRRGRWSWSRRLRVIRSVDTERVAADAERLAGVPFEQASGVLLAEFDYLRRRGLAG